MLDGIRESEYDGGEHLHSSLAPQLPGPGIRRSLEALDDANEAPSRD